MNNDARSVFPFVIAPVLSQTFSTISGPLTKCQGTMRGVRTHTCTAGCCLGVSNTSASGGILSPCCTKKLRLCRLCKEITVITVMREPFLALIAVTTSQTFNGGNVGRTGSFSAVIRAVQICSPGFKGNVS